MKEQDRSNHYDNINKMLSEIPYEKLKEYVELDRRRTETQYTNFITHLKQGICSYCNHAIESFSSDKPCFHWLLNPKGFKKRCFPLLYNKYGFHQLEAYLRWLANTEAPFKYINDLDMEKNPSKIIEITIKYKNLEWSFACSKGDYEGHKDKHDGRYPHYHFQMKCNGQVIINYSGFHVPFNEYDEFIFVVKKGDIKTLKYDHSYGSGMQSVMERMLPEELLEHMRNSEDRIDKGQFHLCTYIEADPGTTISGDEIADILKKSKETGVPVAKLVKELKNVKIVTTIKPGPDIPEIAVRNPRKKD